MRLPRLTLALILPAASYALLGCSSSSAGAQGAVAGASDGTAGDGATAGSAGSSAGSSGTAGTGSSAGTSSSAGNAGSSAAVAGSSGGPCPSAAPASGAPGCNDGTLACSWGTHPVLACRTTAYCSAGQWRVTAPEGTACDALTPGCPTSPSQPCTSQATACIYASGLDAGWACNCSAAGQPPYCPPRPTLAAAPCPDAFPNEGSVCSLASGTVCASVQCTLPSGGLSAVCRDGIWRWETDFSCALVCASPDTPIATPDGERAIAEIRPGDLVYSVDREAIRPVIVSSVHRQAAQHHHVVRVTLANGRVLEISAPHPTADGRTFGDLRTGSTLDGQPILSVEVVPYLHEYTYDILPASSTHSYFAAGMQIGTTLRP